MNFIFYFDPISWSNLISLEMTKCIDFTRSWQQRKMIHINVDVKNLHQVSISSTFAMKTLLFNLILSSLFLVIIARQPYPFRHHQMKPLRTKTQFFKSIKSDLMAFFNSIKSIFNTTKEPLRKHYNKHFVSHMLRTIRHHRKKYKLK